MAAAVIPDHGWSRWNRLFSFAVGPMNRLRFRSKFGLAGALVALMVGVLALSLFLEMKQGLDVVRQEKIGLAVLDASLDALEAVHRQQAVAAGIGAGGEALRAGSAEATASARAGIAKLEALLAGEAAGLELQPQWRAVVQAWEAAVGGGQATPPWMRRSAIFSPTSGIAPASAWMLQPKRTIWPLLRWSGRRISSIVCRAYGAAVSSFWRRTNFPSPKDASLISTWPRCSSPVRR